MGLFPEFLKSFSDSVDGSLYRTFGTTAHLGNLRIAEIVQRIEQEPLPLGVGAERQHRQNFIQRFPLADQFLRGSTVGQAALGADYVLITLTPIPVPPLFMGKVLRLVVGLGEIFVDLYRNGHGLPIVVDGNFHRPFLRSDFWGLNGGGGERQRGKPVFTSKQGRQETTTPAQCCTVRAHEMTQFFMYLQISYCWPE